jgi:hypothetical protein
MFKKWDIIIYILIFVFSGTILYIGISKKKIDAEYVEIHINGELKYKYNLSKEKRVIQIELENGKEELLIEGRSVKKTKATCKNKHCEKQSAISEPGESIICVPNKEIIKISGESDIDYIVK